MNLTEILHVIPPWGVYLMVALLVGIESLGIPVPGETALITASLLTLHPHSSVGITGVALAAIGGAVVGDSIGFEVGRLWGMRLVAKLQRRFPRHLRQERIDYALDLFQRRGAWAVFAGRFVALLRMLSGPLAGSSRMHYPTFLMANASGAVVWAGGTALAIHVPGVAAERYLSGAGWVLLGLLVAVAIFGGGLIRRRFDAQVRAFAASRPHGQGDQA